MSRNNQRSPLPSLVLVAGAALVMGCIVYAEIRARPMIQDETSSQAPAPEVRIAPPPAPRRPMPEKSTFAAIVERPLFSPTRRPHSEETTMAPMPTLDFSLFGIVISTGEPFALIKPDAGGDPVRVKQGEKIFGWAVGRIESDRILVRHDGMERELLLDFAAPAPPAAETPAPTDAQFDAAAQANQQISGLNGEQDSETNEPVPPPEAEERAPADQSSR